MDGKTAERRLPLKTSLRLVLGVTVAASGVAATTTLLYQQQHLEEQARQAIVAATAQFLAQQLTNANASTNAEKQAACDRLLDFRGVLAVAIWDASGNRLFTAALEDGLPRTLERSHGGREAGVVVEPIKMPELLAEGALAAYRVETGIALQPGGLSPYRAGFLLAVPKTMSGTAGSVWFLLLPLATVGIGGSWLGVRSLHRRIDSPMRRLIEAAAGGNLPPPARVTGCDYDDELLAVAESLRGLQADLEHWRDRAEHFERRLDRQIADETQRITRDLRRVQRDACRDSLTGVFNRRMLDEKLPEIFVAQRAAKQDLSVVMLDLDRFKELNDTSGHKAGDAVLAFVGELLRETSRADDIAVRYGGDEFVLILPGVSARQAAALAQRLVAMFDQRVRMMAAVHPAPTLSAGVASMWNDVPGHHAALMELADQALYQAKRRGRHLVHISGALTQTA